jgi:hypothetical protein
MPRESEGEQIKGSPRKKIRVGSSEEISKKLAEGSVLANLQSGGKGNLDKVLKKYEEKEKKNADNTSNDSEAGS